MKRKIIILALLLMCFTNVNANSAPSYWQGYPLSEILVLDQDSAIQIDNEYLLFDFSDTKISDNADYWLSARASAKYTMINPLNESLTVQMIFPFIDSLNTINTDELIVKADDQAVNYDLFIDYQSIDDEYSFEDTSGVLANELEFSDVNLQDDALLYQFKVSTNERMYLTIDFSFDINNTRIIGIDDLGGYSYDGNGNYQLSGWVDETTNVSLLVMGDDLTFNTNAYTGYEKTTVFSDFTLDQTQESVQPKAYLIAYLKDKSNNETLEFIDDTQLLNIIKYYIHSDVSGYLSAWEIISYAESDRMMAIVYEVKFAANETKTIKVGYLINGTMDKTETATPKYSFEYLLTPASYWSSFKDLTIEVITPISAPYIIESSVAFNLLTDNHYQVKLETLPDEELTFTLYKNQAITTNDKIEKILSNWGYYLPIIYLFFAFVISIVFILYIVKRHRTKKHR